MIVGDSKTYTTENIKMVNITGNRNYIIVDRNNSNGWESMARHIHEMLEEQNEIIELDDNPSTDEGIYAAMPATTAHQQSFAGWITSSVKSFIIRIGNIITGQPAETSGVDMDNV